MSLFRVLPINRKQKVFPNGTLVIENVERMSDEATYTCVAKNSQSYTAKGTLEVQVMGKFTKLGINRKIRFRNIGQRCDIQSKLKKYSIVIELVYILRSNLKSLKGS